MKVNRFIQITHNRSSNLLSHELQHRIQQIWFLKITSIYRGHFLLKINSLPQLKVLIALFQRHLKLRSFRSNWVIWILNTLKCSLFILDINWKFLTILFYGVVTFSHCASMSYCLPLLHELCASSEEITQWDCFVEFVNVEDILSSL